MHVDCWIQQVTTRVGAVTCWIQQSVSPKQVVGFSCLFNSEVDQLISKVVVRSDDFDLGLSVGWTLAKPKSATAGSVKLSTRKIG